MAVLFVDVSDSTRIYEALGDTAAFGAVRGCLDLLQDITKAFDGRVVKTIGDGVMCVFPTADAAAMAASEMQVRISRRLNVGETKTKLMIRAGFLYGPVIEDGDDVFGDSVNVAARMAGLALSGQVITSGPTVEALSPHLRNFTRRLDALPVKGKSEEVEVYELLWQTGSDHTVMPTRTAPRIDDSGTPSLHVAYHGVTTKLKGGASFGRDTGSTVVVTDPTASRLHARVELRGGKFILIDQSSYGTFVTISGGSEIRLRREEMILHGSGVIAFGHSARDTAAEVVEFRCEWDA
jgi:class 3 adenylate cyclase